DILKLVSAAEAEDEQSDGTESEPEGPDGGLDAESESAGAEVAEFGQAAVPGDDEAASAADGSVAADLSVDPSQVDTQVPMDIMQHGEEKVSHAPTSPVMMYASKKNRPPVPVFLPPKQPAPALAETAPSQESAPTVAEAAAEPEVPATESSALEVPSEESAPTVAEVAAEPEVPAAESSQVEGPPEESAPVTEVAAEAVPAAESSPVPKESAPTVPEVAAEPDPAAESSPIDVPPEVSAPTPPEDPEAAQLSPKVDRRFSVSEDSQNPFPTPEESEKVEEPLVADRPQWDTDAAMAKIKATAMMSSDAEYEALPQLQSKLRLSYMAVSATLNPEVRKLEAGTAFFDVWRYFESEKKVLLQKQAAAMLPAREQDTVGNAV
ncbi:unnamed protein product, partial [Symbiodinium sp. CCMP2456]